MAALSGVEMGLKAFGVPLAGSGVLAALDVLRPASAAIGAARRPMPDCCGIRRSACSGRLHAQAHALGGRPA